MRTLTEKENEAVKQLKEKVLDLDLNEEQKTNDFLLRFIRAREGSLPKAEEMLRKCLKWRTENNIDSVLDWKPPDIYHKMYPMEICGYTTEGVPIVVIPSRFVDMDMFWEMDLDEYAKYSFRNLEYVIDAGRKKSKSGHSSYEFIGIYDISGLNIRAMMNRKYLNYVQSVSKIFDENYPELIKKAYFVYAPSIFNVLFAMVKHFLPKRTVAKFVMCGSDPEKIKVHLAAAQIPLEVIPPRYGGLNQEFEDTAFKNCGKEGISRKVSLKGEIETDGFVESVVPAGQKIDFIFEIDEPESTIHWSFKTENYDIGFSVNYTHGKGENSGAKENHDSNDSDTEIIRPFQRIDAQNTMQRGSITCQKPGKYILLFDNTYSRIRSKTLHLKIDITKPGEKM